MGDNKKQEEIATRKGISLETKMQVIRTLDSGERQIQISAALNLAPSTIRTILKNKEKILSSATATTSSCATRITRSRNNIIEEMEKRLSVWIDDEIERNIPLSQSIIMEKARRIFNYIQAQARDITTTFVASRGWFDRFKRRNNLHNIKITGEAASDNTKAAASFSNDDLKELTEQDENKNSDCSSDYEEEQKELSMAFLKSSLTTITEIMDQMVENDPNFDRSSNARRGVIDALSNYQQLITERKKKMQTTLDAFLAKRQKIGNRID